MKNKLFLLFFLTLFSFGFDSVDDNSVAMICTIDGLCSPIDEVIQNQAIQNQAIQYQDPVYLDFVGIESFDPSSVGDEIPYVPFPWPCEKEGDCDFYGPSGGDEIPYVPFPWPCEKEGDCDFYGPSGGDEIPYVPFPWPCEKEGDCGFNSFEYLQQVEDRILTRMLFPTLVRPRF